MFASLAPARRRLVLITLAVLVVALVIGVVSAVRGRSAPASPVSQRQPGPVVLVPGYGGGTTGLDELARVLRRHGKDATVFHLPGDGTGDLAAQASALGDTVTQVLGRTRAKSVDVIGYSAGGVVARLWIRDDGGDSLTRRLITLGSPQHGTGVADLAGGALPGACPLACRQLSSSSDLLAQLNAGDETPTGPTYVSIWTTHDDVVLPPDSARLAGARNVTVQSVCPADTVRHSGLPTDPNVATMVLDELAAGAPVPITGVRCVSS